ncbi:hypothetical protein [Pseudarthrobacter sp. DSP2-3-2b1]
METESGAVPAGVSPDEQREEAADLADFRAAKAQDDGSRVSLAELEAQI